MNTLDIARELIDAVEERKGEDILLLDIQNVVSFTDYFLICSGTSDRMLSALAESIVTHAKKYDLFGRIEGRTGDGWFVVDLGDIVVHLFSPDRRDYYDLEHLWEKGKVLVRLQ